MCVCVCGGGGVRLCVCGRGVRVCVCVKGEWRCHERVCDSYFMDDLVSVREILQYDIYDV